MEQTRIDAAGPSEAELAKREARLAAPPKVYQDAGPKSARRVYSAEDGGYISRYAARVRELGGRTPAEYARENKATENKKAQWYVSNVPNNGEYMPKNVDLSLQLAAGGAVTLIGMGEQIVDLEVVDRTKEGYKRASIYGWVAVASDVLENEGEDPLYTVEDGEIGEIDYERAYEFVGQLGVYSRRF